MTDPVLLTYPSEYVALVTLNRPDVANAVDGALAAALESAVHSIETNSSIRAAILAGSGDRAFCAGADLNVVAAGRRDSLYTEAGGFAGFVDAEREKPWIAAIDAAALAGGLELALSCDFIIASRAAKFALPEVKRGLIAAAGGLFRLPRRIAPGIAFEMIATGDAIDAETAERYGLVDRIVAPGEARVDALKLALRICAAAPIAVRESLKVMRSALHPSEETERLRSLSAESAQRNAQSEDFLEGPRAFLARRQPNWTNR